MPKPEFAYHRPSDAWRPLPGVDGLDELILAHDDAGGASTRLLRYAAGADTSALGALEHDFWEEAWIVSGSAVDAGTDSVLTAGMYACRPPGTPHGPFASAEGCLMLEVRYRIG